MSKLEFNGDFLHPDRREGKDAWRLRPHALEYGTGDIFGQGGGEGVIHGATLHYDRKKIPGLVYKKFRLIDLHGVPRQGSPKERLEKILLIWERIKRIKQKLKKEGKPGFNVPPTVRGYMDTNRKEFGLLMTDLTQGGKRRLFDFRYLNLAEEFVELSSSIDSIKAAVTRDVEIATKNNINLYTLVSKDEKRESALDPWLLSVDKEGSSEVFLADVGEYVELVSDSAEDQQKMHASHQAILEKLSEIEREFKGYQGSGGEHDPS